MRRLIVAPHADDEVLGCGGLLAKYRNDCIVVVCAKPSPQRREELEEARAILGYAGLTLLDMVDGSLGDSPGLLVSRLDDILRIVKPDELYLPRPDLHQDHIAVYEAAMRTARISMNGQHWYVPNVFAYEITVYQMELSPTGLRYSLFEELGEAELELKAKAFAAYVSENDVYPAPASPEALVQHARAVGSLHGLTAAEQFAAVRTVRR